MAQSNAKEKKIPLVNQSWLVHFITEANNPLLLGEPLQKACAIQYFECNWLKIKYWDHSAFLSLWEWGLCLTGFLWCCMEGRTPCSASSQHCALLATALVVKPVPEARKGVERHVVEICCTLAFLGLQMANSRLVQASQSSPKTVLTYFQS